MRRNRLKNILTAAIVALLMGAGSACRHPLAKLTEPKSQCPAKLPALGTSREYVERGDREAADGNLACSFDDCRKAIDLDSQNAEAYVCRGYVYFLRQEYDAAEEDFDRAVRLSPKDPLVYSNRSRLYRATERWNEALSDINQAIELMPAHFYYERRAKIFVQLKNYERALADYAEAIRQKPEKGAYYRGRADVYRALGNTDLADADERRSERLEAANTEPATK